MAKIIRVWDGTEWQTVGTALPNALTVDGTQTLTNKTISLGSNTITGTTAQFNTALTDANFATLAGTETLTNKTISGSDNTLTNIPNNSLTNSSITINGSAVSLGGSTSISSITPTDSNISVPSAPTNVTATGGDAQATVSFDVSSDNGGSTILGYTIISSPGNIKKSTTLTTATVTGLTNGTSYTFTVKAHNIAGTSAASTASSSVTPSTAVPVDYLVVAGGGGGGGPSGTGSGASGGGGAGGVRCTVDNTGRLATLPSALTLTVGTTYTVTVGGGGAVATNGVNSSFAGTGITTITSTGGGYGATRATTNAASGGSGGGGYGHGDNNPGAAGTTAEGFGGGNGSGIDGGSAGGGGGAGAVGQTGFRDSSSGDWYAGDGGDGIQTSITGTSLYYGGGGGGGSAAASSGWLAAPNGAGAGGQGGGGRGAQADPSGQTAQAGTANTGGGGGGRDNDNAKFGQAGGSGVVILRAEIAASSTTGSPTYTTSGNYHIYQFTSSGSITY